MPNWCENAVYITATVEKLKSLLDKTQESGYLFNVIKPMPTELESEPTGLTDIRLRTKKYGYSGWHDWRVNNWGTKWDIHVRDIFNFYDLVKQLKEQEPNATDTIKLYFDTAWTPPIKLYEEMEQQGYKVCGYYFEKGSEFCGKYENGINDCQSVYEFTDIPCEIIDELGIDNSYYDDEESE